MKNLIANIRKKIIKNNLVAVINLKGIISNAGGTFRSNVINLQNLEIPIQKAFTNKKVKAVALLINSPGGSPVQAKQIAVRIRQMAKKHDKIVISFCEDVAASGGYWLATAADEIFADQNSIVGSIGVVSSGFGFAQMIEKIGIERRVYTSGKYKSLLDPFVAEKKQDVDHIKKTQKYIHQQFIDAIVKNRNGKIDVNNDEIFSGLWFDAGKALELGLIDGFGEMRQVCQKKFGDNVKFKYFYQSNRKISRLFAGKNTLCEYMNPNLIEQIFDAVEEKSIWDNYRI